MTRARIVFDLDGTLIDSAPDIRGVANMLLKQEGKAPITLAQTHSFIGNGMPVFVQKMSALREIPEDRHSDLVQKFEDAYHGAVSLTECYPGVGETLDSLHGAHCLGICTNKPIGPCKAVLKHLKIDHFFDAVFGGDSLPVRKPDPAPLQATFEAMGTGPCLYVGDSEVDAETAQRAGVPFLLFTEGYLKTTPEQTPHRIKFDSFADLPRLVEQVLSQG
ncbi:MAG: phosphoglycolate phosphatase [Pseudomonadota bacterium]